MKTKTLHFRANLVSRSKPIPDNAVKACAYKSRQDLYDEKEQKTHYYSRLGGLVERGFFAPEQSPEWMKDADQKRLWARFGNEIEQAEDGHNRRASAQLGKDFQAAAPRELTHEQNWKLAGKVAAKFNDRGLAVAVGFHEEDASDGGKNPHFHFLVWMRPVNEEGFSHKKYRALDGKPGGNNPEFKKLRCEYFQCVNEALAEAGITGVYYDPEKQEDITPGVHKGKHATALEKKGEKTRVAGHNRKVGYDNMVQPYDKALDDASDPWAFQPPASEKEDWHKKFAEWQLIRGAAMAARDARQKSESNVIDAPGTRSLRNTGIAREQAKLAIRQTWAQQVRDEQSRQGPDMSR